MLIPRYHPQVGPIAILAAQCRRKTARLNAALPVEDSGGRVFALDSARAALTLALRSLNLPTASRIAVSAYACVTVFEAIAAAGHQCEFVDMDAATCQIALDALKSKSNCVSATILIHMFGFPGNIDAVRRILPGRPIIEDCAHAMGSTNSDGRPLGMRGDAAVFSFNFHKPVSVGGGGALLVNNPSLISAAESIYATDVAPQLDRRLGLHVLVKRMAVAAAYRRPWYGLLARLGSISLDREGPMASPVALRAMLDADRRLLSDNIGGMQNRQKQRQEYVRGLCEIAQCPPAAGLLEVHGAGWNAYLFPMFLRDRRQRDRSLEFFRERGIDAYLLWPECLKAAARFGYRAGDCPQIEDVLKRMMFLPCYAELSSRAKRRISTAVAEWARQVP
jgi:perosamine synthetase